MAPAWWSNSAGRCLCMVRQNRRPSKQGLNTLATSDLRPTVPHVRTPTLVIAGQNDRITAPGASRVLATTLPDARYVEMRRAAHAPFLSHRKEFIAALEHFLQTSDAGTGAAAGPPAAAARRTLGRMARPQPSRAVASTNSRGPPPPAGPRRKEKAHEGPSAQETPGVHTMTGAKADTPGCLPPRSPKHPYFVRPRKRPLRSRGSPAGAGKPGMITRLEFFNFQPEVVLDLGTGLAAAPRS